jgi:L-alanine-DL-glutamate epimerase-like enolase superfamily enzyme
VRAPAAPIERVTARAFRIPTDAPESDGTLAWDSTTLILVQVAAGGVSGLGYSYTSAAACDVVRAPLADIVCGGDPFDLPRLWRSMHASVRNLGSRGLCATAISAVDAALWDLKARLLDVPLVRLLGALRDTVMAYGSGGFTSYDDAQLQTQLGDWVAQNGCRAVKMKIGRAPERDPARIAAARSCIGDAALFVDANGAFARKQALHFAEHAAASGVTWFEEPVSSDDLDGLRLLRDRAPAAIEIAAGEYGYDAFYMRRMLAAGAVDVLQADATRCGGITGFLQVAALADAFSVPLSAHTAPALHLHVCCAAPRLRHLEWFHDHVRIEHMLFDGAPALRDGVVRPDCTRPGNGLIFKEPDAARFAL